MKNYIRNSVDELINKYKTRDPFEILRQKDISVEFNGNLKELKGFFTVVFEKKYVVINSNLSYIEQREVAAHELGHCYLHNHIAESESYREFMLYDMESKPEYEANLFASYLLVSDEEIKYAASLGYSEAQTAAFLNINEKLLKIRLSDF